MGLRQRFLGLCIPPIPFCFLDAGVTLFGQSQTYWNGDYRQVNEASVVGGYLLGIHPSAFLAGITIWIAVVIVFILIVPDTIALIASLGVTFGHTFGAASWLHNQFAFGYQLCAGLYFAAAVVMGLSIRFGWRATPAAPYELHVGWAVCGWVLAILLFAAAVMLIVWPQLVL